ncbi:MAG: hypothetical protein DRP94_01820 [Candidatus Latescibacterota bacterium]|nr:MAG: hypothetical protein DRP94_01820 [Candidatus Latescibacterota bacterium]RKY73127.1 MAG: hypothetical protein DRQ14_04830 [Candidatus Latescibacterota bacterium]
MKRFFVLALALAALGLVTAPVYARRGPRPAFAKLTDDQKAAIRQKVEELRAQGASREEVREAVRQMLEDWGIKPPPRPRLTEEQRAEIREMVKEMKEAGASPAEIRRAVAEKLREWGVRPPRKRPLLRIIFSRLTDDQRAAIRQKVEELKAQGASRQEIRRAVGRMLKEWGVRLPRRRPHIFARLTEEQRAEIREMVKEMKEAGASPEEVRSAVRAKLQEWGIVPPEASAGPSAKPAAPAAAEPTTWGQLKGQFK